MVEFDELGKAIKDIAAEMAGNADPGGTYTPPDDYGGTPGGSFGVDSSLETGRCCSDRIAAVLAVTMDTLTRQVARIANALEDKLKGPCENLQSCMDEIEKEIRSRFEAPAATCDECKTMVQQGLAGTVEYAVRCAGACIEETAKVCSMGSPETWGKPCSECGEPCCECKMGICTPVECPTEPEPEPPTKYIGWCNPETGSIAVSKEGDGAPGVGFIEVSLSDDEQTAALEAANNCKKTEKAPTFTPNIQIAQTPGILCDLHKYADGSAIGQLLSGAAIVNLQDAARQSNRGLLSLGFEGINLNNIGEVLYGAIRAFTGGAGYSAEHMLPSVVAAIGCGDSNWKQLLIMLGQINAIGSYIGIDFSPYTTQIQYALQVNCRQRFLDPDKAIAAYLANVMSEGDLDTHFAVNGICRASVQQYKMAARSKPVPLQLAMMRRRKMIDSRTYAAKMREIGYLETSTSEQLFNLTEQIPTLTDITRLMVRDADDESLVARLGLDDYFEQKYGRQLKEWSEAQGVPEKFARYYWRAHWNIPSPGQLFTFYHRLRNKPEFGGAAKVLDDIKAALIQQDILPYWHQHYLATSFHPIGRIDIRRAYNIGAMKDDELAPAYMQLGYSDETAETLAKFTRRLRDAALPNHRAIKQWIKGLLEPAQVRDRMGKDGIPDDQITQAMQDAEGAFETGPLAAAYVKAYLTRDKFIDLLTQRGVSNGGASRIADILALKRIDALPIKDYIAGSMDRSDVEAELQSSGLHTAIADHLLQSADRAIDNAFMLTCQKGIKRRYLYGELTKEEAATELLKRGTTNTRANKLVDWWDCEKSATGKAVTASKLCHWLALGAISSTDFTSRLKRIGYSDNDAALMVDDCLQSISVKRLAEAKREAKEQAAQDTRAAALARKQLAYQQRLLAQAARGAAQAKQARLNREKQLLSVGQKLAAKCTCELFQALGFAKNEYSRIQRDYGLSADETLQALLLAAEEWAGGELNTFTDDASAFAEAASGIATAPASA